MIQRIADFLDKTFHPGETDRERTMRRGCRALSGFRLDSIWMHKRPFSDKYDGDTPGGGYFGGASPQQNGDGRGPNQNI